MRAAAAKRVSGFTLVELVVVIVILGIVTAFAAPRFFSDRTFISRAYHEELAAALKYAQKLAVASGCPVRVAVAAGSYEARRQAALGGSCNPADASFRKRRSMPTCSWRSTSSTPTASRPWAPRRSAIP